MTEELFKSGASSYSQSPVLLVKQLQCLKLLGKAGGSGAFWFVLINKKKKTCLQSGVRSQVLWHMSLYPELGRQRQENL